MNRLNMDPTQRFTPCVDNYIRYRPHYPPELVTRLEIRCGLSPSAVVADIGSGTGRLTEMWLHHGNAVFAVEPNDAMRAAAERRLGETRGFHSIAGTAEETALPDQSVDFVTAGQAFHWFDRKRCGNEFKRILRGDGWVVLVWNDRRQDTPFARAYESLLRQFGTDYEQARMFDVWRTDESMQSFFARDFVREVLPNHQRFDEEGLIGRILSCSYMPPAGHVQHQPMLTAARRIFAEFQRKGQVELEYDVRAYCGKL